MFTACFLMVVAGPILTVGPGELESALAAVRGKPNATIRLRSGTYRVRAPIVLDPSHAGLTLEAAPGARPVVSGAVPLPAWKVQGSLWSTSVPPEVAAGGARLLLLNGSQRARSRWPLQGEFVHQTTFDVPWMSTTGGGWKRPPTHEELTTMAAKPGDLPNDLDVASAEVTIFHMWDESCVGLASREGDRLRFATESGHPPGAFGVQKYVLWNVRAGLATPGTWFLDREKRELLYHPRAGEKPAQTKAEVALPEVLLDISGTSEKPVAGITVQGISFTGANTPLKAAGFGATLYPGALRATHAPGLALRRVRVYQTAGWGIHVVATPKGLVEECVVQDLGAGGIRAEGDDVVVKGNVVRRIGTLFPSGIGLNFYGARARIEGNLIEDTGYSGIVGGGDGARVEANLIQKVMRVLHDGAGIYIGFQPRVTLRNNVVRDIVDTGGYGASSYYLDEQSVGCVVEGNLSVNVARPMQNHMARGNAWRDNVFVATGNMIASFARCEGYTVERNVFLSPGQIEVSAAANGFQVFTSNVLPDSGAVLKTLQDYAQTGDRKVPDGNSIGGGGKVLTTRNGYAYVPGPAARALGIKAKAWTLPKPKK